LFEEAKKNKVKVVLVECVAPQEVVKERLKNAPVGSRGASAVDLPQYERLSADPRTQRLTISPALVPVKEGPGGKRTIDMEALKRFKEKHVYYLQFPTAYDKSLLPKKTEELTKKIITRAFKTSLLERIQKLQKQKLERLQRA
jgi:hypothetical protein